MLGRFITQQAGAYAFIAVALPLTVAHPLIHHLESGTLDAVLDYVYAATINAMNYGNSNEL